MNILVAFNKNYMYPTMAMLRSLFAKTKGNFVVYVLYSELTDKDIEKFKNFVKSESKNKSQKRAEFIKIGREMFENCPTCEWISKETYYRLLAQKLLPQEVDRILWLDSDLIILDDLNDFYNTDLQGNLIVACELEIKDKDYAETMKRLTLPPDTKYFNAGVNLYDMENIRKKIDPDVYMQYVQFLGKRLKFADQDVLNAVFYKLVYFVGEEYNYTKVYGLKSQQKIEFTKLKIIHYNGGIKPWSEKYGGLYAHCFWKYAKDIPDWNLDVEKIRKQQKTSFAFCRKGIII